MEKLNFQSTIQLRNGVKMPLFGFGTAEIAPTLMEQISIIGMQSMLATVFWILHKFTIPNAVSGKL